MPNFVEFSRENSRRDDDPMFTLQIRGLISMNHAAFKALGAPAAVALLYDATDGLVALKRVAKNYANGYLVRKQGASNSYLVAAAGFVSFNRIPNDVSRRFIGQQYGDYMWGFNLSEGAEVKGVRKSADAVRRAQGELPLDEPPIVDEPPASSTYELARRRRDPVEWPEPSDPMAGLRSRTGQRRYQPAHGEPSPSKGREDRL
jgi:hypothetical protein